MKIVSFNKNMDHTKLRVKPWHWCPSINTSAKKQQGERKCILKIRELLFDVFELISIFDPRPQIAAFGYHITIPLLTITAGQNKQKPQFKSHLAVIKLLRSVRMLFIFSHLRPNLKHWDYSVVKCLLVGADQISWDVKYALPPHKYVYNELDSNVFLMWGHLND